VGGVSNAHPPKKIFLKNFLKNFFFGQKILIKKNFLKSPRASGGGPKKNKYIFFWDIVIRYSLNTG